MNTCLDCGKPIYYCRRGLRGRLPNRCVPCRVEFQYDNTRRWRERNIDYARAQQREYGERTRQQKQEYDRLHYAANADKKRAATKAWATANKDRKRKADAAYRQANLDRLREAARNRYYANPDYWKSRAAERRAVLRSVSVERVERRDVYERDHGRCQIALRCNGRRTLSYEGGWHLDHIIPLSRGGTHEMANVQVSCPACNLAKGDRAAGDQLRLLG